MKELEQTIEFCKENWEYYEKPDEYEKYFNELQVKYSEATDERDKIIIQNELEYHAGEDFVVDDSKTQIEELKVRVDEIKSKIGACKRKLVHYKCELDEFVDDDDDFSGICQNINYVHDDDWGWDYNPMNEF